MATDSIVNWKQCEHSLSYCLPALITDALCTRVEALVRIVLSSQKGYDAGVFKTTPGTAESPTSTSGGSQLGITFDPSVMALWTGKLSTNAAAKENDLFTSGKFASEQQVSEYAENLLRNGTPSLPDEDKVKAFVRIVLDGVSDVVKWDERLILKRLDQEIDETMLSYIPRDICFGPGNDDSKESYYGTGWNVTL